MINFLKDVSVNTLIGELPAIIGFNNRSIEDEFNNIFDSSENRLTKSVYNPTGFVRTHWGNFVNLECEYLNVKNVDSLKTWFNNIPHNYFTDRNFDSSIDNNSDSVKSIDYCHNPASIASGLNDNHSLNYRLNNIDSSIKSVYSALSSAGIKIDEAPSESFPTTESLIATTEESTASENVYAAPFPQLKVQQVNSIEPTLSTSYSVDTNWINVKENEPQGYVYDKSLSAGSNRIVLKTVKTKQEYEDVIKGEFNNYIDVRENNIKIKSNINNILYAQVKGQIVNILLDDKHLSESFLIKINENKIIRISDIKDEMLFSLKLICTQVNQDRMSYWSIYSYNKPSESSIIISKK